EILVTDRDAQSQEQAARLEPLQAALECLGRELQAARSDYEVQRTQASRVPQLQNQLDEARTENRRLFTHTPYGICQYARGGGLTHLNHALVALLGYRTADELRTVDFATTVFESAG